MNNNIHKILLQSLFDSPGGGEWKRVLEDLPEVEIFAAGGCIRDELLQRHTKPKDFDIFVGGARVERLLKQLAAAGRLEYGPFGSPRWHPRSSEKFYCDVIPITRFFNGLWPCENIIDVLNQFDFTANAIALDLRTGDFYDPQKGERDIEKKIMRAVRFDYPDEPIAPGLSLSRPEVVWFRILHYAAVLGLEIEHVTRKWLQAHRRFEVDAERFAATFFPLHPRWQSGLIDPQND